MMLCFLFASLIVALDQFFKHWVMRTLTIGEAGPEIIPGVLGLTRWENDGAMLNILSGQQWLLAAIAFIAAIALVMILLRYNEGFWGTIGLAAVLGGTVGNLIDRIVNDGKVIDMFRTLFITFPIFNIADIFITLGFITFLVHFIILTIKTGKEESTIPVSEGHDFVNFEHSSDEADPDNDDFPDLEEIVAAKAEQELSSPPASASEIHVAPVAPLSEDFSSYLSDDYVSTDTTPEISLTMESLESELGSLEDYNIDDILREYGLEEEKL